MHGNIDLFSAPKNFNFELRRRNEEKAKFKIVQIMVFLSFFPIIYKVMNAQENFKKAGVKEIA